MYSKGISSYWFVITLLSCWQSNCIAQYGAVVDSSENDYFTTMLDMQDGIKSNMVQNAVDLVPFSPIPSDQKQSGACAGFSAIYSSLTIQKAVSTMGRERDDLLNDPFSPTFAYNSVKSGSTNCISGTMIRKVFDFLMTTGTCHNSEFNELDDCSIKPDVGRINMSKLQKIKGYLPLFNYHNPSQNKNESIIKMLNDSIPVIVMIPVFESFQKGIHTNGVWIPNNIENRRISLRSFENLPNHFLTVVSYDNINRLFTLMNSWGTKWADKGFIKIDYDVFSTICNSAFRIFINDCPPQIDEYFSLKRAKSFEKQSQLKDQNPDIPINLDIEFLKIGINENDDKVIPMSRTPKDNVFKPLSNLLTQGDQFQIKFNNNFGKKFLYAISLSGDKKVKVHFPRENYSGRLVNDFITVFPDQNKAFKINGDKPEYLILLLTTKKIPDFESKVGLLTGNLNTESIISQLTASGKYDSSKYKIKTGQKLTVSNFHLLPDDFLPIIIEFNTKI